LDRALLDIFASLAAARVSHGDLKASNFLVESTRRQLLLIDLDAMRLHRCDWCFRRAQRRDLARLLANWDGAIQRHFENLLAPLRVGIQPARPEH
ncbi:MAG: lipopolysaccharide kinase InaA family protein, partial [Porticoccaceae bacterium]